MARLVYLMQVSLDGYVQGADGRFDWAVPDDVEHAVLNEETLSCGTYLLGRRMHEVMSVWETDPSLAASGPVQAEFARRWAQVDTYVWSTTLTEVTTARTQLRSRFDPDEVRAIVAGAEKDVAIEGPTLAAHAFRHGLVDSVRPILYPEILGGGLRFWPEQRLHLELRRTREFGRGRVLMDYDVVP